MSKNRGSFQSNIGAIAAATGSAIGLGNIWRFPYVMGENGGAAFLIIYLILVLAIGIPLVVTEFATGRLAGNNLVGAFKKLTPKSRFKYLGIIAVATSLIITSFYSVIAGWTVAYIQFALTNSFEGLDANGAMTAFSSFINGGAVPIAYMAAFVIITGVIVAFGVEKGIEKSNKILMPILFLILIILCINSFTLEGAKEGLAFMFTPNFSAITTSTVLNALGQAFFSLSLGMGCMLTYGSYMRKQDNIFRDTCTIAMGDVLIAVLAGVAIFPAVFTYGIEPGAGPNLVFVTLPTIFGHMTGGYIFGVLFFLLLFVAAVTSTVSLFEVSVAVAVEELKIKRKTYIVALCTFIIIMGSLCSLSQNENSSIMVGSRNLFDFFDYISASYMLTGFAFLFVLYIGWFSKPDILKDAISGEGQGPFKFYKPYIFIIKYIAPVAILLIFLSSIGFI